MPKFGVEMKDGTTYEVEARDADLAKHEAYRLARKDNPELNRPEHDSDPKLGVARVIHPGD